LNRLCCMTASSKNTLHREWLNERFGYFYSIKKRLRTYKTAFQKLDLVDTDEFGRVLILDGITQIAEKNEFQYHEPMVHPALCTHPDPRRILVIGAGDGAILREVLKYPSVESVDLAELDEGVVRFSKKYLTSIHRNAFDDRRVHIHIVDGRDFVESRRNRFDVVIMDMTDPFGPSKYLYTKDFFGMVKRSFRTVRGVFSMHTESPITRPKTFACIQKTLGSVFSHVCPLYVYIQMYSVLWSITVASDASDMSALSAATIDGKLKKNNIRGLKMFNGRVHIASQTAYPFIADILRQKTHIITDAHPDIPDDILHK
jgi:spermidine synthase